MEYSDYDRDILIRTVLGEAGGEQDVGQQAVTHVILNRANDPRWPSSLSGVALQPKQFSAWNEGVGGNSLVSKHGPQSEAYQRAAANVDAVLAGQSPDVTGGATHYYSPAGMKAHVEAGEQSNIIPRWLEDENKRRGGSTAKVGGHIFTGQSAGYDGSGVPPQYVYNPNGQPADVPPTQTDTTPPVPPMEITGNELIDGVISEGLGTAKSSIANAAVGALMGSGGGQQMAIPAPPPLPSRPMPQYNSGGMGGTIFKISRPKEREKK